MTTTDKDAGGVAITPEVLAKWRKVAEAATQGPWRVTFGEGRVHALPEAFVETTRECMVCRFEDYENDEDNAQHIATACPTNFIALLDHIGALPNASLGAKRPKHHARSPLQGGGGRA